MRWIRLGMVSLFVLALGSVLLSSAKADDAAKPATPAATPAAAAAQTPAATPAAAPATMSAPAAHSNWASKSPDDMAKEALAKWKTTLKLTDEQVPQFESIMKDSYAKMADAKKAAAGDKAKMKASMQTIMKDREDALSKVLTPDQMKTYQAKLNEAMYKAGNAKKHMVKEADAKTGESK